MKKLIMILSTLTITSSLTPLSTVFNEKEINEVKTEFDDDIKAKAKELENFNYEGLNIFLIVYLEKDCSENFGKNYRLSAKKSEFLTYESITKRFSEYLYDKYYIKFNIEVNEDEKNKPLVDGENNIQIHISLFKVNKNWLVLSSDLILKIDLNDDFQRLIDLRKALYTNKSLHITIQKDFNTTSKFISHLNMILSETDLWSDVKVEASKTLFKECSWLPNLNILFILKLNDCSIPLYFWTEHDSEIVHLFANGLGMIKQYLVEQIFSGNNFTYQDFVNFSNKDLANFFNSETEYIKSVENPNKIFTFNGEVNNLKLLIANSKQCDSFFEYILPIFVVEETRTIELFNYWSLVSLVEKEIFGNFNYPDHKRIKVKISGKDKSRKATYSSILSEILSFLHEPFSIWEIEKEFLSFKINELMNDRSQEEVSFQIKDPNVLLEQGHNMIKVIIKIYDYQFSIDFHVEVEFIDLNDSSDRNLKVLDSL